MTTLIAARSVAYTDSHITLHHDVSRDDSPNIANNTYGTYQSAYATTDNGTTTYNNSSQPYSASAVGSGGASGGPSASGSASLPFHNNGGATVYFVNGGTGTYTAASDGTGTITLTAASGTYATIGSASLGAAAYGMPQIPRTTTPTFSGTTVKVGGSFTVALAPASAGFDHRITWSFGGTANRNVWMSGGGGATGGTDGTNGYWDTATGNQTVTFAIPVAAAPMMVGSTAATMVVWVDTYNSGTFIGRYTQNITITPGDGATPYQVPTITGVSAARSDTGLIHVTMSWSAAVTSVKPNNGSEANKVIVLIQASVHGANSWTTLYSSAGTVGTLTATASGVQYTGLTLNTNNNYDIQIIVTDVTGVSRTYQILLGSLTATAYFYDDGTAQGMNVGSEYNPTVGGSYQIEGLIALDSYTPVAIATVASWASDAAPGGTNSKTGTVTLWKLWTVWALSIGSSGLAGVRLRLYGDTTSRDDTTEKARAFATAPARGISCYLDVVFESGDTTAKAFAPMPAKGADLASTPTGDIPYRLDNNTGSTITSASSVNLKVSAG